MEDRSKAVGELLARLRVSGGAVEDLPAELRPRDLREAYAAQDVLVARLLERHGGRCVGYKIGCTNPAAQRLLNTPGPVYGRLLSAFVVPSPAVLDGAAFPVLGIEPELAFELGDDVGPVPGAHTATSVAGRVARVIPSIELVGHRLGGWDRIDAPTLVADNAVAQAWVPGPAAGPEHATGLARRGVLLRVNGRAVLEGDGAAVLGDPLNALAWLANELEARGGRLRAGDIVSTGTCTDVFVARPGDEVAADFGDLGTVALRLGR